jgi:hypothetical protein
MLDDDLTGGSPVGGDCPVATVVIPDGEEGDRIVESSGVRVSVGWATSRIRQGGAQVSRLQRVANFVSPEIGSPPEADRGVVESVEHFSAVRRPMSPTKNWVRAVGELSGVSEGDMLTKIDHRRHGTTRGLPRRQRTAKASRISRSSAKSRCACEWGGWGRVSEDGPGHYNLDRSEGPWGNAVLRAHRANGGICVKLEPSPPSEDQPDPNRCEGRTQTAQAGRPLLKGRPWSRTGENPPYGILGRTMETSASFEARYAPSFYPTICTSGSVGARG